METLRSAYNYLLGQGENPVVDTDEIFPLYFLDNLQAGRVLVLSETFKFNDVLDPEKLHDGLKKLIQLGDWRKLGGRLRKKPDDKLELHVPKEFTKERPAVQFSAEKIDVGIDEHSVAGQLPSATDSPSLHPGQELFAEFSAFSKGPKTLQDYLQSDCPVFRVHVTVFADATVVAFIWPHAVAGALGLKNILSAWSEALKDDGNIPELLGARKDVLDGIGTSKDCTAPYVLDNLELRGWGFAKFAFRLMWTVVWRPKVEARTICLPRDFVSELRLATTKELEEAQGPGDNVFVSEGDVLTAWLARFVSRARGGTRPAILVNPLDVSGRLKSVLASGGLYVQNMAVALYTLVETDVLNKRSLGELAHVVRLSIQQQATEEQMRSQLRHFRKLGPNKMQSLYGASDSRLVVFSNWTTFKMFEAVDFSPAITKRSPHSAGGKPVYMHCHSLSKDPFMRDVFAITGKDLDGNYWISGFLYPEDWQAFEDYMQNTRATLG
ncbi:unnamed protein product [Clonostachys solani]|uniref:Uncharacterized protein n=1 Tax=Clonostachys solani TaxID=160281 RepID=A0A9P0EJC6_9HYPO|nr:unnamed protein product [Clonostachys solani]